MKTLNINNKLLLIVIVFFVIACQKETEKKAESEVKPVIDNSTKTKNLTSQIVKSVQPSLKKELNIPASVNVEYIKQIDKDVYISGSLTDMNGGQIDLSKSSHAQEAEGGVYSDFVCALLHNNRGIWTVTALSVGATDVPMICWWKEFKVSKKSFSRRCSSARL